MTIDRQPWLPIHNFSDLYLPGAFPPYFLSPGTMTSLPDCELHLSIQARNDTHLSSTILYYIISNRCHLCFITLFLISMQCTFSFYYCSNFFYWNLAVFITCYWNNKLTYLLKSSSSDGSASSVRFRHWWHKFFGLQDISSADRWVRHLAWSFLLVFHSRLASSHSSKLHHLSYGRATDRTLDRWLWLVNHTYATARFV